MVFLPNYLVSSICLHVVQILGSAFLLGSESEHLNDIYDHESKELEKWKDSPGEISTYDWRDYLGRHEYAYGYNFNKGRAEHDLDIKEHLSTFLRTSSC